MQDCFSRFDDATDRFYSGAMSAKEYKGISGGMGSYAQRGGREGMVRLRLAGGRLTAEKLDFICGCIVKYNPKRVHITTCQSLQLHDLGADAIKAIIRAAPSAGIFTFGGGGDYPRNVTATPLSGLIASSRFDVMPYARVVEEYLMDLAHSVKLPRKLKVGFSCTSENAANATLRDLGFVAEDDGTFTVYSGGGLGRNPKLGIRIAESVNPNDILAYADAMFRMFSEYGNYGDRSKARVRYMRDTLGDTGYRETFLKFVSGNLSDSGFPKLCVTPIPVTKKGDGSVPSSKRAKPQCQEGLFYVPYHPMGGDPSPSKILELGALIGGMGGAEIRLSPNGLMYIVNLTGREADIIAEATSDGAPTVFASSVSCVGASVCQIGLRDSRGLLERLAVMESEEGFGDRILPMIRISGCGNSCAAHQVGTVGLCGCSIGGEPGFTVFVNGSHILGREKLGTELGNVCEKDLPDMFRDIGNAVRDSGCGSFLDWYRSNPDGLDSVCARYIRSRARVRMRQCYYRSADGVGICQHSKMKSENSRSRTRFSSKAPPIPNRLSERFSEGIPNAVPMFPEQPN